MVGCIVSYTYRMGLCSQYTTDMESSRLASVTQERDLEEFLNTAQLAGTDFTAGAQNVYYQEELLRSSIQNVAM